VRTTLVAGLAGAAVAVAVGMAVVMAVPPADVDTSSPSACATSVTWAALPEWARTGFTGDGSGTPHVIGADGDLIGVLFNYPPLYSRDPTQRTKILWIAGPQDRPGMEPLVDGLRITAHLAGTLSMIQREVPEGPGPSGVNFPEPGCWIVTATWATYRDVLAIPVG
jgi:hypothetical protein